MLYFWTAASICLSRKCIFSVVSPLHCVCEPVKAEWLHLAWHDDLFQKALSCFDVSVWLRAHMKCLRRQRQIWKMSCLTKSTDLLDQLFKVVMVSTKYTTAENTLSWSSTRWMSLILESNSQSSCKLQGISELVLWHNEKSPAGNRTVAEGNRKTIWNESRIFIGWDQDFWFLKKKKKVTLS